jgi:hypothetical protein
MGLLLSSVRRLEVGCPLDPPSEHPHSAYLIALPHRPRYNEPSTSRHRKLSMLRRPDLVEAFEKDQMRREPPDHRRNLQIAEALYVHALRMGALPLANPLEGIEVDIHLAKVINV